MKWLRVLHHLSAGLWFGGTMCIGVLAVICFFNLNANDFLKIAPLIPALYQKLILPAAVFTILQGFIYGFFTNWGFFKYKWLLWKYMTSDRLLAAIYAGIMIGFSIEIVIKAGASTGGMDIPLLTLNKKLGLPVAAVLYGFDFVILLAQMLFANKEQVLYGILMVFIYTVVLDKILLLGQSRTQVQIVSEQYQEINRRINERIDRGSTLIHAETGHLHNQSMVVLTVVANRELPRLNELVLSIDPKAFMIINRVNEVKERGFTLEKLNK